MQEDGDDFDVEGFVFEFCFGFEARFTVAKHFGFVFEFLFGARLTVEKLQSPVRLRLGLLPSLDTSYIIVDKNGVYLCLTALIGKPIFCISVLRL